MVNEIQGDITSGFVPQLLYGDKLCRNKTVSEISDK
jgi:hypothetical protein